MKKLGISADFQAIGSSFVKGNENNLHQPDGQYYLGSGKVPAFGVVNLGARYSFGPHYQLFAEINNLLNRHYYTTGQLATSAYNDSGAFAAREFTPYASGDYPVRNTTYVLSRRSSHRLRRLEGELRQTVSQAGRHLTGAE